jgi:hypothetical protein
MNIKRKGIKLDTNCPLCDHYDEDGVHYFFKCKEVRKCWRDLGLESCRRGLLEVVSSQEFVTSVLKLRNYVDTMVIVLLWLWWSVRNKVMRVSSSRHAGR